MVEKFTVKAKVQEEEFPDLMAAVKVKETKKEKKKKEAKAAAKLSLTDFLKTSGGGGSGGAFRPSRGGERSGGGGDIDIMSLPTAPRARPEGSQERGAGPIGGGFQGYGGELSAALAGLAAGLLAWAAVVL